MTTEELLKPRYKVIADYPDNPFKVGDTLNFDMIADVWVHSWVDERNYMEHWKHLPEFEKYPAVFQKLEWWEERGKIDMPEYAYDNENGGVGKVIRILERGLCISFKDNLVDWNNCKPATKEEYDNQNK